MHVLLVQSFEFLEADIVRFKKKRGGGGILLDKKQGCREKAMDTQTCAEGGRGHNSVLVFVQADPS